MDKMMTKEFYDCLFDNQKVVVLDKYCGQHFKGYSKDIPENLKKHDIGMVFTSDNTLTIMLK